ncbi:hypothetical protein CN692_04915 [Bacillus sp. AFS002410]|uniref:GHMP family kinase ATP-binding protein n=1 Tax=Bacillus sp. AFS002410 TaxID=2033481 RepID=UPI000BF0ABBC|nr:hypothetical protein [Bacillus sp. AFS002410]PEJ59535.1 hypothetical protein CN692_04915 [Bacillus sp. AFS002410]
MNVKDLVSVYNQYYNHSNLRIFFVSGHNNQIEEITENEENGSRQFGIYVILSRTEAQLIKLVSLNFEDLGIIEVTLNDVEDQIKHDWTSYLKKVISYLKQAGYRINRGMDILIYSNLPNEIGLSSSRTIEALTSTMLKTLYE